MTKPFSVRKVYFVYAGGKHFAEFESVWNTEQAAKQYIESLGDYGKDYHVSEEDLLDMPDTKVYKCNQCKDTGCMGERESCMFCDEGGLNVDS